jgi:hypothetical protein
MIEEALLKSNYIGKDGFTWWIGQVAHTSVWAEKSEISVEGTWGARCKVRIIGYHSFDGNILPDEDLPWAQILLDPSFGSSQGGIGGTIHLRGGETCFGFFLDGDDGQQPVIFGLLYRSEGTKNLQTEDVIAKEKSSRFKPFTGHPGNLVKPSQRDSRNSKNLGDVETSPLLQKDITNIAFNSDFGFSSSFTTNVSATPQYGDKIAGIKPGIPAASTLAVEKKADITLTRPNGCENNLIGQITQIIQDFIAVTNGLDRYLNAFIDPVLNEIVNVKNLIKKTASQVLGIVKLIINNLRGTIFKCITKLFTKLVGLVVPIPQQVYILEAMKKILDIIFCILEKLPASLLNFLEDIFNDLVNPINAPACAIEQLTAGILSRLMNDIENALSGIMSGISWLTGGLSSISNILNQASSLASQILSFLECTGLACKTPSVWAAKFGPNEKDADDWQKMVSNVNIFNGISDGLGSIEAAIGETPLYGGINGRFNSLYNNCNQKVSNPTSQNDIIPLPPGVRYPNCIPPIVRIVGDGIGANAVPVVGSNGSIFSVEVSNGGFGYTVEPTVMVVDNSGYGNGATANAIIENGKVSSIYVTNYGFGYCPGNYTGIGTTGPDGTSPGIGTTGGGTGIGTTGGGANTPKSFISLRLISSKNVVTEGDDFVVSLITDNATDGTKINYTISGVRREEIDKDLTGSFIINNKTSTLPIKTKDNLLYNRELFTLKLNDYSKFVDVLIKKKETITRSSQYSLSSSRDFVIAGEAFIIKLDTKEIPDNTLVSYSITGIDGNLLSNSPLKGSFKVIQQKSQILIQTNKDIITSNAIFTLTLDNKKAYVSVLIKAVSTPPITPGIRTDVTGCIEKIIVISPGYGYTTGDKITDGKNTYTPIVSPNSGAIIDVTPLNNPICGFEEPPDLTINTNTGIGAAFVPLMKYYPTYISINKPYDLIDQKRISTVGIKTVIDCV